MTNLPLLILRDWISKNMLVELGCVDIDESKLIRLVERSDLYNDKRVRELS